MSLSLSEKDKKLLCLLLIIVFLGGGYYLFGKLSAQVEEKEKEYNALSDKYNELMVMNADRFKYETDTETAKVAYTERLAQYNTSLSEEQTLVFLGMVEKETGVWLKQVGLADVSQIYTFGKVTSSNPSAAGYRVYTSDYKGISTSLNLSYECSYAQLKDVFTYLETYGKKATISNISFSYSKATDKVSGTMQVTLYAITGSDREVPELSIKDVAVGTGNIFSSNTFITYSADSSYRDKIITDYDLYMIMNKVGSDMDTISVGTAGDPSNEKVVSSNTDGTENVTITVTGQAGQYKVSYKVGADVYPAEDYEAGAPLICGDSLDMLIISKPRNAEGDNSLANVTIINKSDMVLNVAVLDDDVENPRVNIKETQGSVVFYNE